VGRRLAAAHIDEVFLAREIIQIGCGVWLGRILRSGPHVHQPHTLGGGAQGCQFQKVRRVIVTHCSSGPALVFIGIRGLRASLRRGPCKVNQANRPGSSMFLTHPDFCYPYDGFGAILGRSPKV
jgi:hypothetical protein